MNTTHEERRAHQRMELTRPCRLLDQRSGKYLHGTTIDVSQAGVMVRLNRRVDLRAGDLLSVGIAIDPRQALLRANEFFEAEVVRSFGTPGGETLVALKCTKGIAVIPVPARLAA